MNDPLAELLRLAVRARQQIDRAEPRAALATWALLTINIGE